MQKLECSDFPRFGAKGDKITREKEVWGIDQVPFWLSAVLYWFFWSQNFLNVMVSRYWMHLRQDNKAQTWDYSSSWFFIVVLSQCTQILSVQSVIEILRHGKINKLIKSNRFHRSSVAGEGREIWIATCSILARNIENPSWGWQQTLLYNKPEKKTFVPFSFPWFLTQFGYFFIIKKKKDNNESILQFPYRHKLIKIECLFHVYHYEGADSSYKRSDCDIYGIARRLPKFN